VLQAVDNNIASVGELQGCFAISHVAPSAEDVASIDGDDYIIFQNTFNNEAYSYFAIKKE